MSIFEPVSPTFNGVQNTTGETMYVYYTRRVHKKMAHYPRWARWQWHLPSSKLGMLRPIFGASYAPFGIRLILSSHAGLWRQRPHVAIYEVLSAAVTFTIQGLHPAARLLKWAAETWKNCCRNHSPVMMAAFYMSWWVVASEKFRLFAVLPHVSVLEKESRQPQRQVADRTAISPFSRFLSRKIPWFIINIPYASICSICS